MTEDSKQAQKAVIEKKKKPKSSTDSGLMKINKNQHKKTSRNN